MSLSKSQALIAQFYDWEIRGRGWMIAPTPIQLEPPFHPFFEHYVYQHAIIDDGIRPTLLSQFVDLFKNKPQHGVVEASEIEYEVIPFLDDTALVAFNIVFSKHHKVRLDNLEQLFCLSTHCKYPLSFELVATDTTIKTYLICRITDKAYIFSQLKAYFPEASIQLDEEIIEGIIAHNSAPCLIDYGLTEEFMRPILMAQSLDNDPYTSLFGVLEHLKEGQRFVLQVLFEAAGNKWDKSILNSVNDGFKGSFFFDAPEMPQLAQEKISRPLFGVCVRVVVQGNINHESIELLEALNHSLIKGTASKANSLGTLSGEYEPEVRMTDILFRESHRFGMLLNSRELATIAHFPNPSIVSSKLVREAKKTKGAPVSAIGHEYILGINSHQGIETSVGLSEEQRTKHIHLIGSTGQRKSSLLLNLINQDILAGNGVAVLDPHGDLIESTLTFIPRERIQDVVLIDPNDRNFPIAFNILSAYSDIEKEVLASDLVALFKRFSTSWGDQMNSVFANAIIAFLENTKGGTLVDLRRFLIEKDFREQTLKTVTDPSIVYYWQKEFPLLKGGSIAPILTRLDTFLRPKLIRNMVSQQKSLNFQELMDSKKIILVKLSEGMIGAENSFLLGAFIVSKIQQAAMARQATQSSLRTPFYLYIDEFQHFITPSMASMLSGVRKYGLGLVLAHQDMQQVSKYDAELAGALLANAGTRICFRLGDTDAKRLADGFSAFSAEDLQNLSPGHAIARINRSEDDFSFIASTLRATEERGYTDEIIDSSRALYGFELTETREHDPTQKEEDIQPKSKTSTRNPPIPTRTDEVSTRNNYTEPEPLPFYDEPYVELPKARQPTQHTKLKNQIKKIAQANGYKAQLEAPTPEGGRVDVLLTKGAKSIAVEISNSTGATWELHNIQKCLTAGYTQIYAVIDNTNTRHAVIQLLSKLQPVPSNVYVDTSEAILSKLTVPDVETQKDIVIDGYKLKRQLAPLSPDEAKIKRATLETLMQERRKK